PTTIHLRTRRAEDCPTLPSPEPDTRLERPADACVQTVSRVARSASRDETRPVLTGILMSASERELRMVATDSYRLSVKETELEQPLAAGFEVNVPARALQELARVAATTSGGELSVSVLSNQIVIQLDGLVLSSRLIDG